MRTYFLKFIIVLFLFSIPLFSQPDSSLRVTFSTYFNGLRINRIDSAQSKEDLTNLAKHKADYKCGFGAVSNLLGNISAFTPAEQAEIKSTSQRPDLTYSFKSKSGKFLIHYDLTGPNGITFDVSAFADAADSAYSFECKQLGFSFPPSDFGKGGDERYDIYLCNIGEYYGITISEELVPGSKNRYSSFILLNNDFSNMYTQGLDAAKVTIAHEFNHAIQVGNYANKMLNAEQSDLWFYELTATSFEDFVYPDVDDYINYLKLWFDAPDTPFRETGGYEIAHWNHFLQKKYGFDFIKTEWEYFVSYTALLSIQKTLAFLSDDFATNLSKFGTACWFTGYRDKNGEFFRDDKLYPMAKVKKVAPITSTGCMIGTYVKPATINYALFTKATGNTNDSILAVVTNTDFNLANTAPDTPIMYTYSVSTLAKEGYSFLAYDYYGSFYGDAGYNFNSSAIVNNQLITGNPKAETPETQIYPSPYYNGKHLGQTIKIPVNGSTSQKVEFSVYTVNMDLVTQIELPVIFDKYRAVLWLPRNDEGKKLASGVYIYILKTEDSAETGKIAIIND